MHSPEVIDHFEHPRNAGDLPDASLTVTQENPACGDILKLSVKITDNKITAAAFKTRGCVAAIACSSKLTELLDGMVLERARFISREQIINGLGGLATESIHASHLAFDALQAMLFALENEARLVQRTPEDTRTRSGQ